MLGATLSQSKSKPSIRRARVLKAHKHRPPKPQPAQIATGADYLTRQEVAKLMRVDVQTVDYCIRHRGLRASRFSRRVLVLKSDLDLYLQRNRMPSNVD